MLIDSLILLFIFFMKLNFFTYFQYDSNPEGRGHGAQDKPLPVLSDDTF
ncbi:hypothetical protein XSR1_260012 [Xenorhabdus szentirmaii DSM 16338]|uniref:Uncharacterized protein n=1 Tax=Xenorhabdus szentirmaii DSM 16338 TaxID=1427518 RepID=W1IWP9_9GAMM|nr:hypothetical protein Xsze_02107 [Xenorhabdus szentirmaii DSM 16338]CDL82902.1 hypothetical protein XSR1_260012 [Xenorhabdus szentirmaii DSM 16338]